jgi:hypothetical protein
LLLMTILLIGCGTQTPTEGVSPLPIPSGPLSLTLETDAGSYPASGGEIQITLTNHGDESVYLAICNPLHLVEADTLDEAWLVLCEIDYLGYKVEPGESLSESMPTQVEPGTYRLQATAYADCTLGEPKPISARETYYGEFHDCAIQQDVVGEPFDLK